MPAQVIYISKTTCHNAKETCFYGSTIMKKDELIQKSTYIITEYYRNNLEPFFTSIADDVLWIGPRGGQMMRGKEMIIKTWTEEETNLLFSMGNIAAESVSAGRSNLEVLLEYYVYTYFPDGRTDQHHQRLHLSWGAEAEKKDGKRELIPKIYMIHISNISADMPAENKVYAATPAESRLDARDTIFSRMTFKTVCGKGTDDVTYYFNPATILWIESADSGRHSLIHSLEGDFRSVERLRYFEENFSEMLIRAHTSFLVNPLYVRALKRFEVTMSDGTVLPIPEKKYTAFRRKLDAWDFGKALQK